MKTFTVGIDWAYFDKPKNLNVRNSMAPFDVIKIKADSRIDAANKAWRLKGEEWLSKMKSQETKIRKVSLHVNEPTAGVGGKLGRLNPINVYNSENEIKFAKMI